MGFRKKKEKLDNNQHLTEELFQSNEIMTNRLAFKAIITVAFLSVLFACAVLFSNLEKGYDWCAMLLLPCGVVVILVCFQAQFRKFEKKWIRYALLFSLILICGLLQFLFPTTVIFLFFGPIMVSTIYYDRNFTITISAVTLLVFITNTVCNVVLEHTTETMHNLHILNGVLIWSEFKSAILYMGLTKLIIILITAGVGIAIADRGRWLVETRAELSSRKAAMESELSAAADIQLKSMPQPHFTDSQERVNIDAVIRPARETGGDFYDYFMIDDHRLALVVADVSDKGLGAAMFSMQALSDVRFALMGEGETNLKEAAQLINRQLVSNNRERMFITMWLACIDCRTGVGKYVNAGHCNPLVRRKNGDIEQLEGEPQLFMGLFEDVRYDTGILVLERGDSLVLYTDGVTDARNSADETFGNSRLLEVARKGALQTEDNKRPLAGIIEDSVLAHMGDAKQFDDITIMTVDYAGNVPSSYCMNPGEEASGSWDRIIRKTVSEINITEIINEVNECLQWENCPEIIKGNIDTVIDDACTNIIDYAYECIDVDDSKKLMEVRCKAGANYAKLQSRDFGVPFNPLEADVRTPGEELRIGGLGIYLIRNISDDMSYTYEDGQNVLTIMVIWNV